MANIIISDFVPPLLLALQGDNLFCHKKSKVLILAKLMFSSWQQYCLNFFFGDY